MKAMVICAVITSVTLGAFFTPDSAGMRADRVVAQIAAEAGKGLE